VGGTVAGSAPPQPSPAWIDASRFARSPREIGTINDAVAREFQDSYEIGCLKSVDDFVAAKAPNFNKVQQSSTSGLQTIQQQSLRNNRNPQTSTSFNIWFGTRRPVVQIHSPRPFFQAHSKMRSGASGFGPGVRPLKALKTISLLSSGPCKSSHKIIYNAYGLTSTVSLNCVRVLRHSGDDRAESRSWFIS